MAQQPVPQSKPGYPSAASPFDRLRGEIDELFDNWGNAFVFAPGRAPIPALRTDIVETDEALKITAELPGVDEKDIEVTLDGDVLTIRGEKKAEREETKAQYRLKERSWGSFERSVAVPFQADPDSVKASFAKGVLSLVVPKPAEAKKSARKIEVKAGG
jgi:HSP20 family protein